MFGFSPLKILVLAAIIVAVWYGFKMFSRGRAVSKTDDQQKSDALEMSACEVCGDYVPADIKNCGKDNCPYD